jgi:hypothetical protein
VAAGAAIGVVTRSRLRLHRICGEEGFFAFIYLFTSPDLSATIILEL